MRRIAALLLLAAVLFPITVSAKGGGFSPAGGGRSGGSFSPSRPTSMPSSRPQSGTFRPAMPAREAQRAGERASHTTVVQQHTTVVSGGGGGSSWFLPALIGYYAGGGCNRDRRGENTNP